MLVLYKQLYKFRAYGCLFRSICQTQFLCRVQKSKRNKERDEVIDRSIKPQYVQHGGANLHPRFWPLAEFIVWSLDTKLIACIVLQSLHQSHFFIIINLEFTVTFRL